MKLSAGMIVAIFLVSFFTSGFFPALILAGLGVGTTLTGANMAYGELDRSAKARGQLGYKRR